MSEMSLNKHSLARWVGALIVSFFSWILPFNGSRIPASDAGVSRASESNASAQAAFDDGGERAGTPRRFLLPDGFTVERVAGPPLVRYPLFGCFDDAGRLYVAEGTGRSVPGSELIESKPGRITCLEDTDGDGTFDLSSVFADGLVFPQGVLWHDGVVYVASHPAIWRLEDTDGDGRADRRDELIGKFNFNGNGCDIHGPFLGPDARLYWTDGRHGYRIDAPNGTRLEGLASRIWRCRTDGTDLERLAGGGFDNPVELAWTADGEMLGTMDQGAGDCLLHYVEGGVYPEEHPCTAEFMRTGPLLGAVKRYPVELPAALCGTMRYRSTVLGPQFQNTLITTHYMTHKLVQSKLVRDGSTFRAEDSDFLVSSDAHLRLTDVLEDADGSLLVIDMGAWFTYGFLGNQVPRPEMLGSIYRIRRADTPPVVDPRGDALGITERSAGALVELLDDPRPAVRDRAMARLAKLEGRAIPELQRVLGSPNRSVESHSNAIWTLCRIDLPEARAAICNVLNRASRSMAAQTNNRNRADTVAHTVVMAAVHGAGLYHDTNATASLVELLKADDLALRRKVAEALGRIDDARAVPALLDALRLRTDPFLEHSLIYALIRMNDRDAVLPALYDEHPRVHRAALIALDQMPDGRLTREQVVPLLDSDDPDIQLTAFDVISRRREWTAAAHSVLQKWLSNPQLGAEHVKALERLLLAGSGDAEIQRIAGSALIGPASSPATRSLLIGVMRQVQTSALPDAWIEPLRRALTGGDPSLQWEVLSAIRSRGWRQFDETVVQLSRDTQLTPELRVAALECLATTAQPVEPAAFDFLANQLSDSTPPLVRIAAARTLAASTLTDDQLMRLAGRCGHVSTMILRMLLPVFARTDVAAVGKTLVEALRTSSAAESLTVAELETVLKSFPAGVRERAAPLGERIEARERDQIAYLARLTVELNELRGDPDAGKELFLAPKSNCFACHRAVGRGGTIGPDLSKVGHFRTRDELLESLIFPNSSVAPQYQTHTITTHDGRILTGLVARDSADAIYLRTSDLAEHRISRSDVDEVSPSPVSLMPEGLEKTFTLQQLADLIEFLCQQR
jgi:putative heme-binding domain-containing protein